MLVTKLGDGLAVSLPQDVVDALNLREGDAIELRPAGGRSVEVSRASATGAGTDQEERRRAIREFREKWSGWLPDDFKFDREEANER